MFGNNYASRVDKHLGVFKKAVQGLEEVRADIEAHVAELDSHNQELIEEMQGNEKEKKALQEHHAVVGDTVAKIHALLPSTKS